MKQPTWHVVADICGFHDVFTAAEAIEWVSSLRPQQVRDALTRMVQDGTLERTQRGTYRWTGK